MMHVWSESLLTITVTVFSDIAELYKKLSYRKEVVRRFIR